MKVTQKGVDLVEKHLKQFAKDGPIRQNDMMVQRLRDSVGKRVSGADASFYLHEAAEATMMGRGMGYNAAHGAALQKYGVSPFSVYHPSVIQALPSHFNNAWRGFWGL